MLDYPIDTPENVRFHHTLAGPGTRFMAWLIDIVLVVLLLIVLSMIFGVAAAIVGEYATAIFALTSFALFSGYWILLELLWDGRTVGKRALGLRVIGERGLRLTFGQVVLRNLVRFVDMLPLFGGVAACFMLLGREHRRLGDLVAGTVVVRQRRVPPPARIRGLAGERRSGSAELDVGPAALRRVSPAERDLLLDLCMRRDALDDGVRHRLFAEAATRYRERLGLAQQQGVSDEKLVLLLTAALVERLT